MCTQRPAGMGSAENRSMSQAPDAWWNNVPSEAFLSNTITCAYLPSGVDYEQMHTRMRAAGYVIYAGQGDLSQRAFRVANMGLIPQARLDAFEDALFGTI